MRFLILLALSLMVISCRPDQQRAVSGVIDLRTYDFTSPAPASLDGEWDFYPGKFLPPELFKQGKPAGENGTHIPAPWKKDTALRSDFGYGTYHLKILVDSKTVREVTNHINSDFIAEKNTLYLGILEQNSALKVFCNGENILTAGEPGVSRETEKPHLAMTWNYFTLNRDTIDLVIHVSNFRKANGGLINSIYIGPSVQQKLSSLVLPQIGCIGILLVFFMQYLYIWLGRRQEPAVLHFSLFCLFWALTVIGHSDTSRFAALLFPAFTYEQIFQIYYCSLAAALAEICFFCASVFPHPRFAVVRWIAAGLSLLFAAVVVTADTAISTRLFPIYGTAVFLLLLSGFIPIGIAIRRNREGLIFAAGYLFFTAFFLNDLLHQSMIIHTALMGNAGALVLVLTEAVLLSNRFNAARRSNEILLAEVSEKTLQLSQSIADFQKADIQQRRLAGLFHTLDEPLFACDETGTVVFANQVLTRMLQRTNAELTGHPVSKLLHRDSKGLEITSGRFESVLLKKRNGSSLACEIRTTPFTADDLPLLLSVVRRKNSRDGVKTDTVLAQMAQVRMHRGDVLEEIDVEPQLLSEELMQDSSSIHRLGTEIMQLSTALWRAHTGGTTADFADVSGLWKVHPDANGWRRTATLDRYLDPRKFPRFPRWQAVADTANYVLSQVPPSEQTQKLAKMTDALLSAI